MCVWHNICWDIHFEVLKFAQTVNADLYCEQLGLVNQSLIEKCPSIVSRKGVILQHIRRLHFARWTQQKNNELEWWGLFHTLYSPDIVPSDFHLFRELYHFISVAKNFFNLDDVQNTISRYFSQKTIDFYWFHLKLCTLDGKKLLIMRVITSLINNENLLKIYLIEFNVIKKNITFHSL